MSFYVLHPEGYVDYRRGKYTGKRKGKRTEGPLPHHLANIKSSALCAKLGV